MCIEALRKRFHNKKIILGTGCFDILHLGHLHFLKESKSQGDILVMGINSDQSVQKIKGSIRPILNEVIRCELLAACRVVDYVFIFDDLSAKTSIYNLKPNVFAIGETSVAAYPEEVEDVRQIGANLYVIKSIPSISTTSVVQNILLQQCSKHNEI